MWVLQMKNSKPKKNVWNDKNFIENTEIKLCDLGLSMSLESATETFCGTANFICPENQLGYGYDFKADVWAMGSLTFELMTGIPITNFFDPSKITLDAKFIDGQIYLPKVDKITLECVDFMSLCL